MADRDNLSWLLRARCRLAHTLRRVPEETRALRGNLVEKAFR